MNLPVVICSHNRPEQIQSHTLAFLARMGVHHRRVTIYVSDEFQFRLYRKHLGLRYDLMVGGPTLREKRNHILLTRTEWQAHLNCDDDLKNIIVKNPGTTMANARKDQGHWITPEEFEEMVAEGFKQCEAEGAYLWGLCPTNNPAFCREKVSVGLKFIPGVFYGFRLRRSSDLLTHGSAKEEFERTLRHYRKDGRVVRLDRYGVDTVYFSNHGGSADKGLADRQKALALECEMLVREFPGLATHMVRKSRGVEYPDIKLANLPNVL